MATYTGGSILEILTNNLIADGTHTFTANSVSLGTDGVEVLNFYGNQTVTSSNVNDFFTDVTANQDSVMCIRIFHGNLTINSGAVFRPPFRTKGFFVFVKNNLTNSGTISMAERGSTAAAPSGAVAIWSGASIPASGASGGTARSVTGSSTSGTGNTGLAGTNGSGRGTGGGGSGAASRIGGTSSTATSGAGATGTAWSGGAGGGASFSWNTSATATSGSRSTGGGAAMEVNASGSWTAGAYFEVGGGAGNPQGNGSRVFSPTTTAVGSGSAQTSGNSLGGLGTGGLLMVAVLNKYIHNGSFSVAGAKGGAGDTTITSFSTLFSTNGAPSGGGSAGGSFNLIARLIRNSSDTADIATTTINSGVSKSGGTGGDAKYNGSNVNVHVGGTGGAGTATSELSATTYKRHLFYVNSTSKYYYYNIATSSWTEATGTGSEPFELYGLLDAELSNITYSQIQSIPDVSLSDVRIRTLA